MTTRAARNQQAYRDRRKILKQKQVALMLEVLDGIADGSSGITCAVSTDLWGINFDWGGEQSAYDAIEVRCNALGFSLAGIKEIMEQEAVKRYTAQVQDRHDEEAAKLKMVKEHDERRAKIEELRQDQERIKQELADLAEMSKRLQEGE